MFGTPLRHLIPRTTHTPSTRTPSTRDGTPADPARAVTVSRDPTSTTGRRSTARAVGYAAAHLAIVVLMVSVPAAAFADPSGPVYLAANDLPTVISNLQVWVMGILAALATLFLVLGGVYRVTAGGDPAQVEKSNTQFKNALIGYALAVLAPVLLEVVKGIVGG
jgi:hypothetical protein